MNKRLVYVLLPAAVLVWSLIGYRIWQTLEGNTEPAVVHDAPPTPVTAAAVARPPKLSLAYRDPFRVGMIAQESGPQVQIASSATLPMHTRSLAALPTMAAVEPKLSPTPVAWPAVEFIGTIENRKSHRRVALLTIGGQQMSLVEAQMVQGIKMLRVFKDSVQIEFQKQRRTLKLM